MSKQSDAKEAQRYRRELDKCQDCKHFRMDTVQESYEGFGGVRVWTKEKNLRCDIGGFKVHKTAVCDRFERRKDE